MENILIGDRLVGDGQPCFIIAEIGINHNGDINLAKKLIDTAGVAGCEAVKFQKRTIDIVYTQEELSRPRENPFGPTNGDLKRGLEFGAEEYDIIDDYCHHKEILWSASPWDIPSVNFLETYNVPFYKVASACLTDSELIKRIITTKKPVILSTGMSTIEEIDSAVALFEEDYPLILLHTCSTYPSEYEDINLKKMISLKERYGTLVGYSGHETGIATSVAAVTMGACIIERHITLDRAMWGSDQAASLGPSGIIKMINEIRLVERALGDTKIGRVESEIPVMEKLRRVK